MDAKEEAQSLREEWALFRFSFYLQVYPNLTNMQKKYNVYNNLGYWFLLLILLVFGGFYTSYFSVFFQPKPTLIHIHFVLMALWIIMLITQPFLIKYKKLPQHRLVGKFSYFLVPLLLIVSYLVIRHEYYGRIAQLSDESAKGLNHLTAVEILKKVSYRPIALVYFFWFGIFYLLAIINRRRSPIHARYMLALSLTMLGPTFDRLLAIEFHVNKVAGFIPVYTWSFLIINIVLSLLLIKDFKNKKPAKTLTTCLVIYIAGQILFFVIPQFDWWSSVMAFIMKPLP